MIKVPSETKQEVIELLTRALVNPTKIPEIINKLSEKIKYIQRTLEIITDILSRKGGDVEYKILHLNILRDCIDTLGIPVVCQLNDTRLLKYLRVCYSEHQELKNKIDIIINLVGYMVGFHKDELNLSFYYDFVNAIKPDFKWESREPADEFEKTVHQAFEVLNRCKETNQAILKPSDISNRDNQILQTLTEIETLKRSFDLSKPNFKPIRSEFIDNILLKILKFEKSFLPLAKKIQKNLEKVLKPRIISPSPGVSKHPSSEIELHKRTYFVENEILTPDEDECIEYKDYRYPFNEEITKTLAKSICSFLNHKGGRIYIGVEDTQKMVSGLTLTSKDRDRLKLEIIHRMLNDFFPNISHEDFVKVEFVPVHYNYELEKAIPGRVVVKIIVKQGDSDQLYSVTQKALKCFVRRDGFCKYLEASQILSVLKKKWKNEGGVDRVNPREFNDPRPDRLEELPQYNSAPQQLGKQGNF